MKELGKTPAVVRELVSDEAADQRVDNYLLRCCKGVPKSHIYQIVRSGQVRVNGKRVTPAYRLKSGDELRIPPLRLSDAPVHGPAVRARASPEVIFEDADMLVLNKPAGMAVHGGSGISHGVIELIRHQRPDSGFIELVHRLDRETSGVLMLAKKRSALTALHHMLREGTVRKRYLALVDGRWMPLREDIRLPLHKYVTASGERRVAVRAEGKPSLSTVRLRARWQLRSLLDVELKTGRTHQIRVHLAHLGFPICGDDKYGDFALNKELQRQGLKRMFLHATGLSLRHPRTGEKLELNTPLPQELSTFLAAHEETDRCEYRAPI